MKRKIFTTALLSFCFMICLAGIFATLDGKWVGSINTPDGNTLPVTYVFKVDGEKLTGTATSPMGDISLEDGKIKGDAFSFKVTVNGTGYPHTGKVYADSCAMDIDFGGSSSHFVVKRAK